MTARGHSRPRDLAEASGVCPDWSQKRTKTRTQEACGGVPCAEFQVYADFLEAWRNAATTRAYDWGDALLRNPTTGTRPRIRSPSLGDTASFGAYKLAQQNL